MLRVENLIKRSRRETENEEFSDNTGIAEQEFIDYLNDSQKDLQSAIARMHQNVFTVEENIDVVFGQESYPLPKDILLDNRISYVWFSRTGQAKHLRKLRSGTFTERLFDNGSDPVLYIRSNNKLLLSPIPNRAVPNGLKLVYIKKAPDLDIRRAKVSSVVLSGNTITSLTLDIAADLQRDELLEENYFCTVDVLGNQTMRRILFTDINTITGEVTIDPSFVFEDGETITAGNYLVKGFDSVNISTLADTCERYLVAYVNFKALKRDSSSDSFEQSQELLSMRGEIVDLFAETDDDVKNISIDDTQFIDDDWSNF